MKNIVGFFTNIERGASVLRRLGENGHRISAFVAPETIIGTTEGNKLAIELEADVINLPASFNDSAFLKVLNSINPMLIVLVGFNRIIPRRIIELPQYGVLNLHGGPLPHYRGGSALNWQILNGETKGGVSIIRVEAGVDTGPILCQRSFDILDQDDIATVHAKANALFPEMVLETVSAMEDNTLAETPQDSNNAVYWHQRSDVDGAIDFYNTTASSVHNLVRALTTPYPGAHTRNGSVEVRILKTEIPEIIIKGTPGTVLYLSGDGPFVICADIGLRILSYTTSDGSQLRHKDRLSNR